MTVEEEQMEYAARFCHKYASRVSELGTNQYWSAVYGDQEGYYFKIDVDRACENTLGTAILSDDLCTQIMQDNAKSCEVG